MHTRRKQTFNQQKGDRMNLERFHILYDHLIWGTLGHERFNFLEYNSGSSDNYTCGTSGCAIGECPIIWEEWVFSFLNSPILKWDKIAGPMHSAEEWFEIGYNEFTHLFIPRRQDKSSFGGIYLNDKATRYQVASNIKAFIDKCYVPKN